MFKALIDIVHADAHVEIVYPVHLNPNVYEKAKKILVNQKRIHLLNPLPYDQLIFIMSKSYLILTDSGGIQEEAPSLKKPILVMRDETERPEGLSLGIMKLVGRDRKIIVNETIKLLNSESHYNKMVNKGQNPYGDGLAAKKITRIIDKYLTSFNKLESHNIN